MRAFYNFTKFDKIGGWCSVYGTVSDDLVQRNCKNNYTIQLKKKRLSIFINGGFVYSTSLSKWDSISYKYGDNSEDVPSINSECFFLGKVTLTIREIDELYESSACISMIKIKTGWFSSTVRSTITG